MLVFRRPASPGQEMLGLSLSPLVLGLSTGSASGATLPSLTHTRVKPHDGGRPVSKAAVGAVGLERAPHEALAVGVCHAVDLVALHHRAGTRRKGGGVQAEQGRFCDIIV